MNIKPTLVKTIVSVFIFVLIFSLHYIVQISTGLTRPEKIIITTYSLIWGVGGLVVYYLIHSLIQK